VPRRDIRRRWLHSAIRSMITQMGLGRLIRLSRSGDKPSATYIVCETDAAKAIEIVRDGVVAGSFLDDIQDLGRVSEELLKAMSIRPGEFVPVDRMKHVSQLQQQPVSKKS
jgi:hypothetical protein